MELKHLNKDEFEQAVNAGDELVVVDFFANSGAVPCKDAGSCHRTGGRQIFRCTFFMK